MKTAREMTDEIMKLVERGEGIRSAVHALLSDWRADIRGDATWTFDPRDAAAPTPMEPALAAPPAGVGAEPEPPGEHEGTTLINELMMSGDLWARMANEAIPGATPELDRRFYEERMRRATMIRRRAEHVRAILGAVNETAALSFAKRESVEEARLLNRLCGPLAPAGTGGRR